ncbi:MAG: hypothetical protein KIT09_25900 [Bryobacteraceae bacterium]|nr:hypothetical protein [Bryobacteraceae bacterium]
MRGLPLGAVVLAGLGLASVTQYESAKRKIDLVANDQAARGSTITLTGDELAAYAKGEIARSGEQGVREPQVKLGSGTATGTALIDFNKLMESNGRPPNWLLARLLDGEKPVAVTVRMESGNGLATVHVERVEVSGVALDGAALQFLIKQLFLPRYPDAKIGEPFELSHNMEEIRVQPANVLVKMAR